MPANAFIGAQPGVLPGKPIGENRNSAVHYVASRSRRENLGLNCRSLTRLQANVAISAIQCGRPIAQDAHGRIVMHNSISARLGGRNA